MPTRTSERPQAQVPHNLDALDGVDLRVQVAHLDPLLEQVVGEGGDQHPVPPLHPVGHGGDQVVDLALGGLDDDLGVHLPGGPHDLLDDLGRLIHLIGRGGGRNPCSTSVSLRVWSPSYWPWSWGR